MCNFSEKFWFQNDFDQPFLPEKKKYSRENFQISIRKKFKNYPRQNLKTIRGLQIGPWKIQQNYPRKEKKIQPVQIIKLS